MSLAILLVATTSASLMASYRASNRSHTHMGRPICWRFRYAPNRKPDVAALSPDAVAIAALSCRVDRCRHQPGQLWWPGSQGRSGTLLSIERPLVTIVPCSFVGVACVRACCAGRGSSVSELDGRTEHWLHHSIADHQSLSRGCATTRPKVRGRVSVSFYSARTETTSSGTATRDSVGLVSHAIRWRTHTCASSLAWATLKYGRVQA